jgi:membrane fusion protein, heavy metal efflux system
MKDIKIIKSLFCLLSLCAIVQCGGKKVDEKNETADNNRLESNEAILTKDQMQLANVTFGQLEMKNLSGAIKVNGMLDVPPQNLVSISAPMGGFLKNTELLQGMKVKQGQVIAVIQNLDYIQLQQDYVDNKSQLDYLKDEFKRQEELARDNVNSGKIVAQSKSQYLSMLAKVNGLKSKLNVLGVNVNDIESGNFTSNIVIKAPINGYVTQVNVNIGMFVNPTDVMFKIVDTEHLHAELTVFEKDVPLLKIGQKVRFILANETEERLATIHLIGREIGADRTVRIHCHLDKEDMELLPGMYLKAFVEAGAQNVMAIPDKAIVNYDGADYIFVKSEMDKENKQHFKMLAIKKGVNETGYTELILPNDFDLKNEIVINGAFDILAKMKNAEEE